MYAARGLTEAEAIEARFDRFRVTCDGGCEGASDEFDGDELDRGRWTRIVREDASRYRVEDGALVLMTDRGEFDRGDDSTRNIVLQPMPEGSWSVEAVVQFVPRATFQHAGIAVYQDDQNFVRIHRIMGSDGDRFTFVEQHDGGATEQTVHSRPLVEFEPSELAATPHGYKSWFMLEDQVALLGAGISAASVEPVETIIENRKLTDAPARLVVDGVEQGSEPGWQQSFDDVSWAHLQGQAEGADIGYVFPGGASFSARREVREGVWTDVNTAPTFFENTPLERPYLTMWFDHGVNPRDAAYAWVLLPGATVADVRAYEQDPSIEVLANSDQLQAVRSGGVLAANFWTAGSVSGLTCDGPASVVVDHSGYDLAIAVADATHRGSEINVELKRRAVRVSAADPRVRVNALSPAISLTVDVSGAQGQTAVARFELAEAGA